MPDHIERARQLLVTRLGEIDAERRDLTSALANLGGGAPGRPRRGRPRKASAAKAGGPGRKGKGAGARRKSETARPTGGRAPRGRRREQLLAAIAADPGARPADLARTIGIRPAQVHALIARARADKLIIRRGKGYAAKA